MPRFSANISMLFKELEFPERFEAAAHAGFKAVEIQFPYTWEKGRLAQIAQHAGVEVVLINIPAGDPEKGDRGIVCLPGRVAEFREGVAKARSKRVSTPLGPRPRLKHSRAGSSRGRRTSPSRCHPFA